VRVKDDLLNQQPRVQPWFQELRWLDVEVRPRERQSKLSLKPILQWLVISRRIAEKLRSRVVMANIFHPTRYSVPNMPIVLQNCCPRLNEHGLGSWGVAPPHPAVLPVVDVPAGNEIP
jgi:hypothetical protein